MAIVAATGRQLDGSWMTSQMAWQPKSAGDWGGLPIDWSGLLDWCDWPC